VSLRIFEQLALVLKNRVALKLFTVLHIRYIKTLLRLFEQLALALKKQSCPEIFHCIPDNFRVSTKKLSSLIKMTKWHAHVAHMAKHMNMVGGPGSSPPKIRRCLYN